MLAVGSLASTLTSTLSTAINLLAATTWLSSSSVVRGLESSAAVVSLHVWSPIACGLARSSALSMWVGSMSSPTIGSKASINYSTTRSKGTALTTFCLRQNNTV